MKLSIPPDPAGANAAATGYLAGVLTSPGVRNVMLAGGNTPLELYRRIAARKLPLSPLTVFALHEYVGVPLEEPRDCAHLIRRTAAEPWGVRGDRWTEQPPASLLQGHANASVLLDEATAGAVNPTG